MKLLENSKFEELGHALSVETEDCAIDGRLECYSCKMTTDDKKLFRTLSSEPGMAPADLQALSPPTQLSLSHSPCMSPGEEGILCDTISTKTLFHLICTLNASFYPDYDFSTAGSSEFSREPSLQFVKNAINSQLLTSLGTRFYSIEPQFWTALDEAITLHDCLIYSYNPDLTSDPYGEDGCIWSFNYFFYNRKLKRLVFFTCRATCSSIDCSDDVSCDMFDIDQDVSVAVC
jgi:hypothetical protein